MYTTEKSDLVIVPGKVLNKGGIFVPEEALEGRARPEGSLSTSCHGPDSLPGSLVSWIIEGTSYCCAAITQKRSPVR